MKLIVGLTGGIVCGKTTVAKMFEDLGAKIIDVDILGHKVILPHQKSWEKIIKVFGKNILKEDLKIDRAKLGNIVFNDKNYLKKLNEITHPEITRLINNTIKKFKNHPFNIKKILIVDAPLIYEAKIDKLMDKIITVYIDEEEQIKRLIKRNHFPRHEAIKRIRSQMQVKEKIERSDYVIDNNHSLIKTKNQVKKIWGELIKLANSI